jgi:hypothetical protein
MKTRRLAAAVLACALAPLTACGNVVIDRAGAAGGGGATTGGGGGGGGSADAPCLVGGNVLFVVGDSTHPAPVTVQQGMWAWDAEPAGLLGLMVPSSLVVSVYVPPTNPMSFGDTWALTFTSDQLAGMPPLAPQVYPNAAGPGSPGQPGLGFQHVSPAGDACNDQMGAGQFEIEALDFEYGSLHVLTATFEQSCNGVALLRGCVHYGP